MVSWAVADDGRRERRLAFTARHRQALAGDGLLVDQGPSGDDLAVDRDHSPGIDHDLVADRELSARDRGHDAVADDPCGLDLELEQFANGAPRAGRGEVANPIPELDQPGDHRAGQRIALRQRGCDRERIENIDVEAAFALPHPPRAQRDRVGVPQHQGKIDGAHNGIGAERERERQRRQHERHAPQQRLVAVDPPAGRLRRTGLRQVRGAHQVAQLDDAHEPQAAYDGAQQRLVSHVVFDDQAGAVIVDARALDAVARAQPGERSFGQRPPPAQRRNMQAHAPRNEMANGQFHCGASPRPAMQRALSPSRSPAQWRDLRQRGARASQ
jgi:hypothetical protein